MKEKIVRNIRECLQVRRETGLRGMCDYAARLLDHAHLKACIRYVNSARPRRYPRKVQIEATSMCNLKCPSCSRSRENNRGRHLLPQELTNILNRFPFRLSSVILSGCGEPLLNPHFGELVDILSKRGIKIIFFTNGTLLTPRKRAVLMACTSIKSVAISCDSANKETFETLRVGADFDQWTQFVREFVAEAHSRRPAPLLPSIHTVLSKNNIEEAEAIVKFVSSLGFHRLHFMDPVPVDEVAQAMYPTDAEWAAIDTRQLYEFGKSLGVHITFSLRRLQKPPDVGVRCLQPWEYILVHSDGSVAPCSAVFGADNAAIMGNLFDQDFKSIWHGESFSEFRRTSASGTNNQCRICPYS